MSDNLSVSRKQNMSVDELHYYKLVEQAKDNARYDFLQFQTLCGGISTVKMLSKDEYNQALIEIGKEIIPVLREVDFFQDLDEHQKRKVARIGKFYIEDSRWKYLGNGCYKMPNTGWIYNTANCSFCLLESDDSKIVHQPKSMVELNNVLRNPNISKEDKVNEIYKLIDKQNN